MEKKKIKNKYAQQFDHKDTNIKDVLPVIIIVVVLIVGYFALFYKDKTPYGYAEISPKLDTYLKTASPYAAVYNSNKMMVVYHNPKEKENGYPRAFKDAVEAAKRNLKISQLYEFQEFYIIKNNLLFDGKKGETIINGEKAFKKACRDFCIVNPKQKSLYFYYEPKTRDVQYLESNLTKLEQWGSKLD